MEEKGSGGAGRDLQCSMEEEAWWHEDKSGEEERRHGTVAEVWRGGRGMTLEGGGTTVVLGRGWSSGGCWDSKFRQPASVPRKQLKLC